MRQFIKTLIIPFDHQTTSFCLTILMIWSNGMINLLISLSLFKHSIVKAFALRTFADIFIYSASVVLSKYYAFFCYFSILKQTFFLRFSLANYKQEFFNIDEKIFTIRQTKCFSYQNIFLSKCGLYLARASLYMYPISNWT